MLKIEKVRVVSYRGKGKPPITSYKIGLFRYKNDKIYTIFMI